MRVNEFLTEQITWESFDQTNLSVRDKLTLLENHASNRTLSEDIDSSTIEYINAIKATTIIKPVINNWYIGVALMILSDTRLSVLHNGTRVKYIKEFIDNDNTEIYQFELENGNTTNWPNNVISKLSYTTIFLFDTVNAYNQFKSLMALKFRIALADITNNGEEI